MKNILLVVAGLVLFVGSFAAVALVSGRHPSEIPGLGLFVKAPEQAPVVPAHEMPSQGQFRSGGCFCHAGTLQRG